MFCSLHDPVEVILESWGAKVITEVRHDNPCVKSIYFCLINGLWYYAHTDGKTVYMPKDVGYPAVDGKQAYLMFRLDRKLRDKRQLEQELDAMTISVVELEKEIQDYGV